MSRLVPAPDALVGKRFDVAVAKRVGISRAKAAELIEGGQARVLGRDISKSSILQSGETVEFDIVEERTELQPIAGMIWPWSMKTTMWWWLTSRWVWRLMLLSGWTGPTVLGSLLDRGVHITLRRCRASASHPGLDVGTSGLMLVCKSDLVDAEMRRHSPNMKS